VTALQRALQDQAQHCSSLGSPFMAQLCSVLAQNLQPGTPLSDRLFTWPGNVAFGADAVPLRLCAAFHALHLLGRDNLRRSTRPTASMTAGSGTGSPTR